MTREHNHYFKDVANLETIDVYRVLQLFGVTDPCLQHAIKKLLVAGGRGSKNISKDVHEAIVSCQRWEEMRKEDAQPSFYPIEGKAPELIKGNLTTLHFCTFCQTQVTIPCTRVGCPVTELADA